MTDWDKLCEEFEVIPVSNGFTLGAKWKQVRAVGDEMQNDARKYRLLQEDDPDASIVISDELNEACLELDELRQKLEAVRELFNNPPYGYNELVVSDYDFERWSEEILVLLGVRKEMQEKEKQ